MLRMTGMTVVMIALWGCGSSSMSTTSGLFKVGLSSISPLVAITGSPDLMLTVTGANFAHEAHNKSLVVWSANGVDTFLITSFNNGTQLTALIPADLLANEVEAQVLVETGDPEGSFPFSKSNSVILRVSTTNPGQPSITTLSPTNAAVGSPDLTLTITGSNFANDSDFHTVALLYGGLDEVDHPLTTFDSSTQVTALIPARLLDRAGTFNVKVWTLYKSDRDPTWFSNNIDFSVK
jgi:hypothetical protein